jgi:phage baseplate assembly protein W
MASSFIRLPLNLGKVIEGENFEQCSLKDSIENHVKLILITKFGENRFNLTYGCEVWNTISNA